LDLTCSILDSTDESEESLLLDDSESLLLELLIFKFVLLEAEATPWHCHSLWRAHDFLRWRELRHHDVTDLFPQFFFAS